MKKQIVLLAGVLCIGLSTGCVSNKAEEIFRHLKDDPAKVRFRHTDPWTGSTEIDREFPPGWSNTNSVKTN